MSDILLMASFKDESTFHWLGADFPGPRFSMADFSGGEGHSLGVYIPENALIINHQKYLSHGYFPWIHS